MTAARRPLAERFVEMVDRRGPDQCWMWTGPVRKRYGAISAGGAHGRTLRANRVAWELANKRSIPGGLVVRHSCDTPLCCNPSHLILGTHKQNSADRVERFRHVRGTAHPLHRLTDDDVREVLAMLAAGHRQRDIAEAFGVSQRLVWGIKAGTHWPHVPRPS